MKKYTLIFLLLLLAKITIAQVPETSKAFYFSPTSLAVNSLRVDIDFNIGGSSALSVSPQFFANSSLYFNDYNYYYDPYYENDYYAMYGFGLDVHHKIYHDTRLPGFFYTGYGIVSRYHKYNWDEVLPVEQPYENSNVNALFYQEVSGNAEIIRGGVDLIMGYGFSFLDNFMFEIYTGVGIRYSHKMNDIPYSVVDLNVFSPTYTGVVPVVGIKTGFGL